MSFSSAEKQVLWGRRLATEFDQICFTHRLKLKRPVISVEPLGTRWGSWDPEIRTIQISSFLIESYPWQIVLEVFKHEMAHQYVNDLFDSDELHGPLFRLACDKLGVADWAAKSESELDPPANTIDHSPLSQEEERLLGRVEKLLNLATSSNEHEAALAMQRVQELYAKYNLDRLESRRHSGMAYLIINLRKKKIERHLSAIASLLNDFFFVEVVHASLFDAEDLCEYKILELLGTRENVLMAEYVYHFLCNQLRALWNGNRSSLRPGMRARNSFYLGVLAGFREKLERPTLSQATGVTALTVPDDPELQKYLSYRYPRLVRIGHGRRRHDGSSFEAGREHGRSLVLHRGIANHDGNRGRLLNG